MCVCVKSVSGIVQIMIMKYPLLNMTSKTGQCFQQPDTWSSTAVLRSLTSGFVQLCRPHECSVKVSCVMKKVSVVSGREL